MHQDSITLWASKEAHHKITLAMSLVLFLVIRVILPATGITGSIGEVIKTNDDGEMMGSIFEILDAFM